MLIYLQLYTNISSLGVYIHVYNICVCTYMGIYWVYFLSMYMVKIQFTTSIHGPSIYMKIMQLKNSKKIYEVVKKVKYIFY